MRSGKDSLSVKRCHPLRTALIRNRLRLFSTPAPALAEEDEKPSHETITGHSNCATKCRPSSLGLRAGETGQARFCHNLLLNPVALDPASISTRSLANRDTRLPLPKSICRLLGD